MTLVPGGAFRMGSADFYPEEGPVTAAQVESVWVDDHPVTNAAFRRSVGGTGHVTIAERAPDPADFPGADPGLHDVTGNVWELTATRWAPRHSAGQPAAGLPPLPPGRPPGTRAPGYHEPRRIPLRPIGVTPGSGEVIPGRAWRRPGVRGRGRAGR